MYKKVLIILSFVFCFTLSFISTSVKALEETDNAINEEIQNETVVENQQEKEEDKTNVLENEVDTEKLENNNEEVTNTNTSNENESDIVSGEIYDVDKLLVTINKVDEEGNLLEGAKLQILDSEGNVIDEWVSTNETHEILLPDGKYILHEVEAPEGYDLADDKEFVVKVEIADIDAGVDFSETPCPHYDGTPLYYVEIEGKKHEVYCINQDWETPDENSIYDGEILDSSDIKDYTQQTVYIDAHQNQDKIDVSDQTLSSQELYDKILDIIYHRHKAANVFNDLTEAEIRYVTESALKNYTNAGLTRVQRVGIKSAPENYDSFDYYITADGKYMWYLYPWYRSFVYDPTQPLGKDIYRTDIGNGDAFGNLARHWSDGDHNAKNSEEVRAQIARYYELYKYLINDEDHHPSDMHLYIYSTNNSTTDSSRYNFDEGAYQNLLGITGYFEDVEQQKQEVEMVNKYSTETTKIDVKKVWEDWNDCDKVRPTEIVVSLKADGTVIDQVTLSEETGWEYSFTNLPVYDKAHKIVYTVFEETIELTNLKDLYDVVITGNAEEGFVITNYYSPKGGDNPPTGDKIYLSITILLTSLIGFISCIYLNRRFN